MIRKDTISDILTNMLKDSLVNEHIQIRFGTDQDEKNYLWREVKAYKSAKLEEILETTKITLSASCGHHFPHNPEGH